MRCFFLGLLLFLVYFSPAAPPKLGAALPANWVTHPAASAADHTVLLFRKEFSVAEVPDSFTVGVTADNQFRLYLNGELITFGPQLGDIDHWRYDSIDLAPYLQVGENTLAIQVVNWGYHRGFGIQSVHTALLVQGYGAAGELTTTGGGTDGYVCTVTPAIRPHIVQWRGDNNDIIGGLYANNPTDSLYAARYPWGWQAADYATTAAWVPAMFLERGNEVSDGSGFRWMLQARTVPPRVMRPQRFKATRIAEGGIQVPEDWHTGEPGLTLPAGGSYRLLLDMEEVTMGLPVLRWSGGAGAQLKCTWAENLFNPDATKAHRDSVAGKMVKGYFDVIRPDGGQDRRYLPTWLRTFRYLEVQVATAGESLTLFAPVLQRVTSSIPLVAEWSSDDPQLDRVVEAGRRTVEICTQDYFLSDAYYETMQYIGDSKVHALVWQALSGDTRHTRNALLDFDHARNPEGVQKSCYPLRHNFYHSSYSLIYIDMVYDYFARTGDTAFVRPLLPGIRLTLDYFDRHYDAEDALLKGIAYTPFIDWYPNGKGGLTEGADPDAVIPHTLLYAHALRSATLLAEALNDRDQDHWGPRFEQVVRTVRDKYYVPQRKLIAERPSLDYFDQHSTILGLLTGVVPAEDRQEALTNVVRDTSLVPATYYFRYYLLQALTEAQRPELFREVVQPWYDMVAEGATTQVERFETPNKPTRSEAHPWGTSPALFVYTLLAGIEDRGPGEAVRMQPTFGHLNRMQGFYPYLAGEGGVTFSLERSGAGIRGEVTTTGRAVDFRWEDQELHLPAGATRSISFR